MTVGEPMADRTTPTEGPLMPRWRTAHRHPDPAPAKAADLIDQLRADDISLVYNPATKTLSTDANDTVALSIS
jgi:hypothetical protein